MSFADSDILLLVKLSFMVLSLVCWIRTVLDYNSVGFVYWLGACWSFWSILWSVNPIWTHWIWILKLGLGRVRVLYDLLEFSVSLSLVLSWILFLRGLIWINGGLWSTIQAEFVGFGCRILIYRGGRDNGRGYPEEHKKSTRIPQGHNHSFIG